MGCLGALMLLPYSGACWLAYKIVDLCAKKGGAIRLGGVLASLALGGICVGLGYWGAFIGYPEWEGNTLYQVTYPVWGWFGIVAGGLTIIVGSLRALTATRQEMESEEEEKRLRKETKKAAFQAVKEVAKGIIKQDKIDVLDETNQIIKILEEELSDNESLELAKALKRLKKRT
ncbi:hypothetical protein ACFLWZ_04535 [Chloroflexota bacterium]